MKKTIYILLLFLTIILIAPLLFADKVEFDIPQFITQYYIFLANAILLVIFGFFINSRLELLKESYNRKDKKKKLKAILSDIIKNLKAGENIDEMIYSWNTSIPMLADIDIDVFLMQTNFNKYSKFISSIQNANFNSKRKVPEFDGSIKFLINLKQAIENELH